MGGTRAPKSYAVILLRDDRVAQPTTVALLSGLCLKRGEQSVLAIEQLLRQRQAKLQQTSTTHTHTHTRIFLSSFLMAEC